MLNLMLHIKSLPLTVPLGFCLPKSCNSSAYFDEILAFLNLKTHQALAAAKEVIDFDGLHHKLENATGSDVDIARQITAVIYNGTEVAMTATFPDEDRALQEEGSHGIWITICVILISTSLFTCLIPNIYLIYTHSQQLTIDLPKTLEALTL